MSAASGPPQEPGAAAQRRLQQMLSLAPEQCEELVLCHLSRRLDLEDDKLDVLINGKGRPGKKTPLRRMASPFQRKSKEGERDGAMFADVQFDAQHVNAVSKLILSLQNTEDLRKEGLFRVTGSIARQDELKERILQDCSLDLSPYTMHDRANVIKQLLGDWASPLLLNRHFEAFRQAVAFKSNGLETGQQRCLRVVQLLMLRLPQNNLTVCRRLLPLLQQVAREEASNKMCARSLGTLFAPHFLCPRDVNTLVYHSMLATAQEAATFLVQHGNAVFHVPAELSRDVSHFLRSQKRLSEDSAGPSTPLLNRSTGESLSPVNTSLSFVPRGGAGSQDAPGSEDTTRAELAKLQVHIQSLPQQEKRRFRKHLNGGALALRADAASSSPAATPCSSRSTPRPRKHFRSKSIGSSIKKRLPTFGSKAKRHASCDSDAGLMMTVVNINFEDNSSSREATIIDCHARLHSKATAATEHYRPLSVATDPCASPPGYRNRRRRHHSEGGDPTPPKVECSESTVVSTRPHTPAPAKPSTPTAVSHPLKDVSCSSNLPGSGKSLSKTPGRSPKAGTPSPLQDLSCSNTPLPFSENEISLLQATGKPRRLQEILTQAHSFSSAQSPLSTSCRSPQSPEKRHGLPVDRCCSLTQGGVKSPISVETSL